MSTNRSYGLTVRVRPRFLGLRRTILFHPMERPSSFSLRSGIQFADGEPLNSSAVYFSLNRILIEDGSTPVSHGTASWIVQQLLNASLSTALSGHTQPYTSTWVNEVLAQDFVQITGPLTFNLHLENPNAAWPVIIGASWAVILAPNFVMQHDLSLWNRSRYRIHSALRCAYWERIRTNKSVLFG